ncbi:MAG: YafY family transcriptional regulator [Myxococcales bacterium]|nr:YafY family transcriptional regulator [Myxococcales bacterium]
MRRADRLFQIVQRLRRRGATTAAQLAHWLEVSERTIYRDIQDLVASGVPIRGEAGVGYLLERGFDLPPLMFTESEIEALVLGARLIKSCADAKLARAAEEALLKVEGALPERLRARLSEEKLFAPMSLVSEQVAAHLAEIREAIHSSNKVSFDYIDRHDAPTQRTVHPLGLFYWGRVWSLGAWCELRDDFRNFRLDRMTDLQTRPDRFEAVEGRTLVDMFRQYREEGL